MLILIKIVLNSYYQDVQSEFESDINDIKSFFIDKGYGDVQSILPTL